MSNYLDKIAFELEEDTTEEEFMLPVSQQNDLLRILYSYEDFVVMSMDYMNTGVLYVSDVRKCILHVFRTCHGIADIRQSAFAVLGCIDNIEPYWIDIERMLAKLFKKFDNT